MKVVPVVPPKQLYLDNLNFSTVIHEHVRDKSVPGGNKFCFTAILNLLARDWTVFAIASTASVRDREFREYSRSQVSWPK
jgi:hypothetical protein